MMELPGQKKKFDDIISRLDTMHESDGQPTGRQTVRQTDTVWATAKTARCSVKTDQVCRLCTTRSQTEKKNIYITIELRKAAWWAIYDSEMTFACVHGLRLTSHSLS